jgi:hypothetical protein
MSSGVASQGAEPAGGAIPASWLPFPPHGRGARQLLPHQESARQQLRRPRHCGSGPQQMRALGPSWLAFLHLLFPPNFF